MEPSFRKRWDLPERTARVLRHLWRKSSPMASSIVLSSTNANVTTGVATVLVRLRVLPDDHLAGR